MGDGGIETHLRMYFGELSSCCFPQARHPYQPLSSPSNPQPTTNPKIRTHSRFGCIKTASITSQHKNWMYQGSNKNLFSGWKPNVQHLYWVYRPNEWMQGQEGPAWCFLRGHCSVAHTPAPAPAVRFLYPIKVTITPLSITTAWAYHCTGASEPRFFVRLTLISIHCLSVTHARLSSESAQPSFLLLWRAGCCFIHQQQQQQQQSGPTRQRRGRRQGQSGETAGAKLKTILTTM